MLAEIEIRFRLESDLLSPNVLPVLVVAPQAIVAAVDLTAYCPHRRVELDLRMGKRDERLYVERVVDLPSAARSPTFRSGTPAHLGRLPRRVRGPASHARPAHGSSRLPIAPALLLLLLPMESTDAGEYLGVQIASLPARFCRANRRASIGLPDGSIQGEPARSCPHGSTWANPSLSRWSTSAARRGDLWRCCATSCGAPLQDRGLARRQRQRGRQALGMAGRADLG